MSGRPIAEDDLHAFADDQLDPRRRADVAAWLEQHPDAAARVAAWRDQRAAIAAALAPVEDEAVPSRLNLRAIGAARRRPPAWRGAASMAAAVLLVFGGGLGGWALRGWTDPVPRGIGALAEEAASSYAVYAPDRSRPIEIAASDRIVLDHWFSQRLGRRVSAPDLASSGFRLLGGRLVATPHGPAGMFFYQNGDGVRVAMLVRPMTIDKDAAMRRSRIGATDGYAWADRGLGYSLVGPASLGDIDPLAGEARRQLIALGPA